MLSENMPRQCVFEENAGKRMNMNDSSPEILKIGPAPTVPGVKGPKKG